MDELGSERPPLTTKRMSTAQGGYAAGAAPSPSANLFVRRPPETVVDDSIRRPSISYWQDAWIRLKDNKIALAAGAYIVLLTLAALIVPEVIPYKYDEQEIWNAHSPPTLGEAAVVVEGSGFSGYQKVEREVKSTEGDSSAQAAVTGFGDLPAPEALSLMAPPLSTGVAFQWSLPKGVSFSEEDLMGFQVYRSISPGTLGVPLGQVPSNELSYLDLSALDPGERYFYAVKAVGPLGESAASAPLEVEPKLALNLDNARQIDGGAKAGDTIQTNPHYLGTDSLGRDLLARIMIGARISLLIGFCAPLLYVLIGIVYGSISGYFGGLVDDVMMRVTDVVATVPELLVVILMQVMMGSGIETLLIAIVAVAWARSARQIRGEVLRVKEMEFVQASKVLGTPFRRIVGRHLLPNVMGTVLVIWTLAVPQAIFTEAFLSFIGLGIAPPMASWGTVTKAGAQVYRTYPHILAFSASLICVTMLAFNLFGDGLRDALDPKLRGTK